jgi:hypothetical protein
MKIDWSKSKTLPTELWKSELYSLEDRLVMADGAVNFYKQSHKNVLAQLEVLTDEIARLHKIANLKQTPTIFEAIHMDLAMAELSPEDRQEVIALRAQGEKT